MKLKLMEVSSTDTNAVEVKFRLKGDNMSSEEISPKTNCRRRKNKVESKR